MKKIVLLLIGVLMLIMVSAKNSMHTDRPFLWKRSMIAAVYDRALDPRQISPDEPVKSDAPGSTGHMVVQEFTETAIAGFYPSGTQILFTLYL